MITHDIAAGVNTAASVPNRFTGTSQSISANVRTPETTRPERETGIRTERNEGVSQTERESTVEEARRRREEQREDVVAVSEDGDTVQVSEEGNEELLESRDGSFALRRNSEEQTEVERNAAYGTQASNMQEIDAPEIEPERPESPPPPPPPESSPEPSTEEMQERLTEELRAQTAEKTEQPRQPEAEEVQVEQEAAARTTENDNVQEAVEAAEKRETERTAETITTYAGISKQRLEQMYRDGQISQRDYNRVIEAREARMEELRSDMEDVNEDTAGYETLERNTENTANAIRSATGDEANETLTAEQRLDMIEAAQNNNKDNLQEARREEEQGRLWDYQLLA